MVGEIRDGETGELAVHAALTGHLVLSTLHTNTAVGAIPRLMDMGLEPFLITASLNMVVGQRLVKRICEKCKEPHQIDQDLQANVMSLLEKLPEHGKKLLPEKLQFYRGKGCKYCNGKGTKGRIAIHEVLEVDEVIEKLVTGGATEGEIEEAALQQGMVTMQQDGVIKALKGLTSVEEVWRVINA
jgi:type II secretory ATPase GspE/PulE/Tfp pilus assembly ATPase PilB-like protein